MGSFAPVVREFLGNHKAENCVELVAKLEKTCSKRGGKMSLKVHMLNANPDKFMKKMGAYSEEHGERFHQDTLDFERCYLGEHNEGMISDYT